MVLILKKGVSKKKMDELLEKIHPSKGFDSEKHCGVIKLNEDPSSIQNKLRDEW
jgi:hypothetical protein